MLSDASSLGPSAALCEGIGTSFCIFRHQRNARRFAAEMFSALESSFDAGMKHLFDSGMQQLFAPIQREIDRVNKEQASRELEQKEDADHKRELQNRQGLQTMAERLQADPICIILAAKVCPLGYHVLSFVARAANHL